MTSLAPAMIDIPTGSIVLHDARTKTSRTVDLQTFRITRTAVTWELYTNVSMTSIPRGHGPTTPVHSVSWLEAVTWCNMLSQRLGLAPAYAIDGDEVTWDVTAEGFRPPTEAEWEWACRAGTDGPHYAPLPDIAWTDADKTTAPQEVGRKLANAFGLFDMLGNVWEWCWDYADPARYGDYRVIRGGGWSDKHWSVRASVRRGTMPGAQLDDIGFRVAQGAITGGSSQAAQGWSHQADQERARLTALPLGWTPLRQEKHQSAAIPHTHS